MRIAVAHGVGRERPLSRQRGASTPIALDPIVQGGGASCGLVQCAGRAQFGGRHPWSVTQLLKAGLGRSSINPNVSMLTDRGL